MNTEPVGWSEEKQKHLHEYLTGLFAEDTWEVGAQTKHGKSYPLSLRFPLLSAALKTELKYALWYKFERGEWAMGRKSGGTWECTCICQWLNAVAPTAHSLMERSLPLWELSFRSWLVETNHLRPVKTKGLLATQTIVEYAAEDRSIVLFRQVYKIVADAYDDRQETEKDIWDMRVMGLALNRTATGYILNFTLISQLWLRELTKAFMKYNSAVHSPSDCISKLTALRTFSQFLAQFHPHCSARDLNRELIVEYISYVRALSLALSTQLHRLIQLRTFLETCAYHLNKEELPRERLIFDEDLPKQPKATPRDIPDEVLEQLREHLDVLPTTILRMTTILLECGMRISELCSLPLDCLINDDRHEWYLRMYQIKGKQEHVIPLINETVIGAIQAQQEEIRAQMQPPPPYLFPRPRSAQLPYQQQAFRKALNKWALEQRICGRNKQVWRFQAHQFRHTVGMRLINDDVPLDVISRLLGHHSLRMTQVYARVKDTKLRDALQRAALKRKTVDATGHVVKGDARANDPEAQLLRKGVRGQTLPVGGCGRLVVLGGCPHANSCVTCTFWLTSTEDLPALKQFHQRAVRLRERATQAGNVLVIQQQDRIIPHLALRINSLEQPHPDEMLSVEDLLVQLRTDLAEAESALEEVCEAGMLVAIKLLERTIIELKANIAALEDPS
jgi:integrase/recombinase XerD